MGLCQNSPFNEIILATDSCSEDEFLFIRVLTYPLDVLFTLVSLFLFFKDIETTCACKIPQIRYFGNNFIQFMWR